MLEEKMLEEEEEKINLNVIILGDKGVGKSSIIQNQPASLAGRKYVSHSIIPELLTPVYTNIIIK